MRQRFLRITLSFLILLFLCIPTADAAPGIKVDVTPLSETKHHSLYRLSVDRGAYTVNMVASVGKDGVLLVDTGEKEWAEELKKTIKAFGKGIPKIIINTHAHVDHTGGNHIFGHEPVIIAHDILRTRLVSGDYSFDGYSEESLPDIGFADGMSLYFNGEEIKLTALPGSHDDNDVVVHFTASGVACLGDLSFGMEFPTIDDLTGNAARYAAVLEKAIALLPDGVTIVSGHGKNLSTADLKSYQQMLADTTERVRRALANGKDLETMRNENILKPWDAYGKGYLSAADWLEYLVKSLTRKTPGKSIIQLMAGQYKSNGIDGVVRRYKQLLNAPEPGYEPLQIDFLYIGVKLFKNSRYRDAIRFLKASFEVYPKTIKKWKAHFILGRAYRESGDRERAVTHLRESLRLNPKNKEARDLLIQLDK